MKKDFRAVAEVNLDAVAHNICEIKKCLNEDVRLMAVVKANGYGHGACAIAREALENGADYLAVAFADEAIELRKNGFFVPILVLGNSHDGDVFKLVEYDITATVSDAEFAEKLSDAALEMGKVARIHLKIDTGMSRIGFDAKNEKTIDEIQKIAELPALMVEGMFTHFASADEADDSYTRLQFQRFMAVADVLEERGIRIPVKHVCNSAGLIKFPEMHLDMVRAGIIIYGIYPSSDFDKSLIDLAPAMEFKARISHVKTVEPGVPLSYGRTYAPKEKSVIATVSAGYADGVSRNLSGKTKFFGNGCLLSQVGRICMDQCMIDVTKVNNINVGDTVTLFGGTQGALSAEEVAELTGTIGYETVCAVGGRVPRIYIKNGKETENFNYVV